MYNITCWYIALAIGLYLLFPILYYLIKKNTVLFCGVALILCFRPFGAALFTGGDREYLLSFSLGLFIAKFDLFDKLGATDSQLDFPYLYACGRNGWAIRDLKDIDNPNKDLTPLFQLIVDHVPAPDCNGDRCQLDAPFTMLATTLEADPYVGRILTGKIESGTVHVGQTVKAINMKGEFIENAKITKIIEHQGIQKASLESASAGDIVVIAGFSKATVADTLCDPSVN